MSTIIPKYKSVQDLLKSESFSIDEYQREYKWEKKHVDELLTDLLDKFHNCYKRGDNPARVSNYEEYFLGSIIVSKRNGKNYLIDGQQRVTSLTLLLIYLYQSFQKRQDRRLLEKISPLILGDHYGELKFNLDIPERLPVIKALFEDEQFNPDGKDESVRTIYARYEDIGQNDQIAELDEELPHFAYWLMGRVSLIEIATDDDSYAYAIFETMNDRGKPLSPVDMLKAYLLAPIESAELRRGANDVWKKQVFGLISWNDELEPERDANCLKAWLRAQYADSTRARRAGAKDEDWERIGTIFHRWVRDNRVRLALGEQIGNFKWMTSEFPFFAKAYKRILDACRTYTEGLEAVFFNAHNDFTWQTTVLLAPLVPTDDDETVRRKIGVTATYLDIWLMRRVVNLYTSRLFHNLVCDVSPVPGNPP